MQVGAMAVPISFLNVERSKISTSCAPSPAVPAPTIPHRRVFVLGIVSQCVAVITEKRNVKEMAVHVQLLWNKFGIIRRTMRDLKQSDRNPTCKIKAAQRIDDPRGLLGQPESSR
jgi:hypothetical protein